MKMFAAKTLALAGSVAFAAAAGACNGTDRTASNGARGHEGAPINLTGCLQKSGTLNTSYILTQVNTPTQSVGTTGSTSDKSSSVVEQQQLREAKHAYQLDGDGDQLDKLVGKQVRVEGTIAENSDLSKRSDDNRAADAHAADSRTADAAHPADKNAADSARVGDNDHRLDIDAGDLAKVNVKSIAQLSDACSDAARQPQQ